MTTPLTWKNSLSLLAAACVAFDTVIPLVVELNSVWKIIIGVVGAAGVIALTCQLFIQSAEDREREQRDKELGDYLKHAKVSPPVPMSSEPPQTLQPSQPTPAKPDLDGELCRIFVNPRIGVSFQLFKEIWKAGGHPDNPRVDCDILVLLYVVNRAPDPRYIRDVLVSVEVGGVRKTLERQDDFRLGDFGEKLEYGWDEDPTDAKWPVPLTPFVPEWPYKVAPAQPVEGWIRFILHDVDPEKIDANTWSFTIVDSIGNEHPITKTAPLKKKGDIGYREFSGTTSTKIDF